MRDAGPRGCTTRSTDNWFRAEWEGLEKIPDRRRRAARRQPRRRHPVRRAGHHARHRDRARAARLRPGRLLLPDGARGRHAVGPGRRRRRPPRQRLPPPARAAAARARLPRGHQGPGEDLHASATSCAASAAAASSRSPCGPACPSIPIAVVGAEESMPIALPSRRRWPRPSALPYFPVTANMLAASGPLGLRRLLPGQVQAPGARPGAPSTCRPTRSATRRAGSWTSPSTSATSIQETALRHAARAPQRLVRVSRDGPARPHHRPGHVLGRPGGPGPRGRPDVDVILGLDTDEPDGPARAHRVRPGRRELLDPQPHRAGHPGRHHRAHLPGRRLDHGCEPGPARDQRHRHHEPAGRGRRRRVARCATSW